MVKNIFLSESLTAIGGIESFEYNIGLQFKDHPDIEIEFWYYNASEEMLKIFEPLGKCVKWDKKSIIKCDNFFFPSRCLNTVKGKVEAKNIVECFHMAAAFDWNTNYDNNFVTKYIGVSKASCEEFTRATGQKCDCYYPIVKIDKDKFPKHKRDSKLRLITCARLNSQDKGAKRMLGLASVLNAMNVDYEWTIAGKNNGALNDPHFRYLGAIYNKEDLYKEIVKNDFSVQLSDCEGFGMAISESLNLEVPIVCTPISVLREHNVDDGNCIVLKFDGSNVTSVVSRMLNEKFDFDYNMPKSDWESLLKKV